MPLYANPTRSPYAPYLVTSRNHPVARQIRLLHRRDERDRTSRFYIEGMRFVAQALHHHASIEKLIVCPDLLVHPFARKLASQQRQAGAPIVEVTPDVMHSIALADDPQGIGAVVRQRWTPIDAVSPRTGLCWVAVDTVQSPGNLGTILRTCEAVGAAGVICVGDDADPYDPAAVRASMGAHFALTFVRTTEKPLLAWKSVRRALLVGTSPTAETDYCRADYPCGTILWMGWERKGLSPERLAVCDTAVRIPMVGRTDSLNLAVATSVLLYEVFNQRRGSNRESNSET